MDIITFDDDNGDPVMLLSDRSPSVIMDIDDAEYEIVEEVVDGKNYMHIRKDNGFSFTMVMTSELGARKLSEGIINLNRVNRGLPKIDVNRIMNDIIDKHNRGESLE